MILRLWLCMVFGRQAETVQTQSGGGYNGSYVHSGLIGEEKVKSEMCEA